MGLPLALIGLLPAACYAAAILLFSRLSLNEAEHRRIAAELEARVAQIGRLARKRM